MKLTLTPLKHETVKFLIFAFLILDATYLTINFYITHRLAQGAVSINLSGRQRMLSQRMTKAVALMRHEDQGNSSPTTIPKSDLGSSWQQFTESFSLFDATLQAFRQGGVVLGGDGVPVHISPVHGQATQLVEQTLADWQRVSSLIHPDLGRSPAINHQRYDILSQYNDRLLAKMNQLTSSLQQAEQAVAVRLRWLQLLTFLLSLIIFSYLMKLTSQNYQNLEKTKNQYETILEKVQAPILILDHKGNIIWANPAALNLFQLSAATLMGQPLGQFLHRDNPTASVWMGKIDGATPLLVEVLSHPSCLNGETVQFITLHDVTQHHLAKEQLRQQSHIDPLTGLPNRLALSLRLEESLIEAQELGTRLAVVFLDLDGFKEINDTFGHEIGDQLLQQLASRIKKVIRGNDIVARISGDEFVLVLQETTLKCNLIQLVDTLNKRIFKQSLKVGEHLIHVSGSLGVAVYPDDGKTAELLLRNADTAMYYAKQQSQNSWHFYDAKMTKDRLSRLAIANNLRQALNQIESAGLSLVYQPKFDLKQQRWCGFEALLRWQDPELGIISPNQFIPIAEESDLIHLIGDWVLLQTCYQAKQWENTGVKFDRIAVNISRRQLLHPAFIRTVESSLEATGLSPHKLELEVTESFIVRHSDDHIAKLKHLRDLGITVAIDDFGTGYSSLSQLKKLPIDILKIDRSFITGIPNDPDDIAITAAILALGNSLDLKIVAEGVETAAHVEFLHAHGCHIAQGYYFSRPVSADQIPPLFTTTPLNFPLRPPSLPPPVLC